MNKQLLPSVARTLKAAFTAEQLRSFGVEREIEEASKRQTAPSAKASWKGIIAKLNKRQAQLLNGG